MKEYDLIIIGTGSAMNFVDMLIRDDPEIRIAVIDKDEPGGICLTRGCIPTKILVHPADLVRTIGDAGRFGIDVELRGVDFRGVMERMHSMIREDTEMIRAGLSASPNIDYYADIARFTSPYTLEVGGETIRGRRIFLCTGSRPLVPDIDGLDRVRYHTSDTILEIDHRPRELVIIGGGYIAAEFGHFFAAMGSKVTILGRNPQFLKMEEPEVSALAVREMSRYLRILTGHEVIRVERGLTGKIRVVARDLSTGREVAVPATDILVAVGRAPNTDLLRPERGGIETDERGWIVIDEHMRTSQPNVWAFGDATGRHLFKHVANHESVVAFVNAFMGQERTVDHHAVPHAVFTHPEIASVGLREREAIEAYGEENVLIGFQRYEDTAKGSAMGVRDMFVKVILKADDHRILGAHIIGPQASVLIREIIDLMYTPDGSARPIFNAMYIHPALPEVVQRAFSALMPPAHYHHMLSHQHAQGGDN
ncbi:MAG TPA: dihydrolipoyl dehydrogenase [Thermoplasmata archaeon]|nr:dihydrolipoyl dehydrogenase [Thermoplasmata archaeon]